MDNIDIIERYLKGQLSAEEEKSFRDQLKTDKEFRDEVLATSLMIKKMNEQNQEKEDAILEEVKTEAAEKQTKDSEPSTNNGRYEVIGRESVFGGTRAAKVGPGSSQTVASINRNRLLYWISSIAALFVIGFFSAKPVYFNYKSNQMISQNYAQWTPRVDATSRGEVQAGENVVAELRELFENVGQGKDMKMTTYRLEKALKESETDYEYNQYTPDIVWYLALAYIQNNQFGKARTALAAIIESGDPYYFEAAQKLYKEIENMYFM